MKVALAILLLFCVSCGGPKTLYIIADHEYINNRIRYINTCPGDYRIKHMRPMTLKGVHKLELECVR